MDRRTEGTTESRKLCPSAFLRKGGGQKVHSTLGGRKDGRTEGWTESRNLCPSALLRKGGGQ